MRMGESQKQLALMDEAPAHPGLAPVGPDHLGHAAAVALDAPRVVDVERTVAAEVGDHLVARGEGRALGQETRGCAHPATPARTGALWPASAPRWLRR